MAIAIDGSSPIRFTGTPANNVDITSASFTPPASSVLVVCVSADTNGSSDNITISVSGSSLTWVNRVEHDPGDASANGGHASIWTPADGSTVPASAQTVSVRRTAGNGSTGRISVKVYVVTGADTADPTGATGEGHSTTNNITPNAYTSTVNNSRGFGCATDWMQLGTPTSTDTEDGADYSGAISVVSLHKAADTATSGSTVTMNFDAGGTGNAEWNWVALEILPGAGGTTFNITPSGTVTPAGALAKQANKAVSGSVTPSGALSKLVSKVFGGSVTPAGVLQTVKVALLSLAGSVTPVGSLARQSQKGLSGSVAPAGALSRLFDKILSGTVTPAGALATIKVALLSLSGTVTPVGNLAKSVSKGLSGIVTPVGSLFKFISKFFAGLLTPSGSVSTQILGAAVVIRASAGFIPMGYATTGFEVVTQARVSVQPVTNASISFEVVGG